MTGPLSGRQFWKMTGSGNDFVFFDCRTDAAGALTNPGVIGAICDRRRGVGADGIVLFESDPVNAFSIRYFNRDGSLAELCGNASLCSVTLAAELGAVQAQRPFTFQTSSGVLTGQMTDSAPRIEIAPVTQQAAAFDVPRKPGEKRIGYARVGVPHLVVLVDDVETVDVASRGRELRNWPTLADGANANFVSRDDGNWRIRTYERGVEEETLACGTGAVAACALLSSWHLVPEAVDLNTRSGSILHSSVAGTPAQLPTLSGEGRLVFVGTLRDVLG